MKKHFNFTALIILAAALLLFACPEPQETETTRSDYKGQVFKGPFLVGSSVAIYELDDNLIQTGKSFTSTIISDDGTYDITGVPVSGNIEIVADGFFFDEITGKITNDRMTMRTITNSTGVVNINLFSVLQYDRVKKLFAEGKTLSEAKSQSITELLNVFGFQNLDQSADSISLTSANAPALLAVSSMFTNSEYAQNQSKRVSEIEELITRFRVDFIDGNISADIVDRLKNASIYVISENVRVNLQNYFDEKGIVATVPAFTDTMNNFLTVGIPLDSYKIISDYNGYFDFPENITVNEGYGSSIRLINNSGSTIKIEVFDDPYNLCVLYSEYGCSVENNVLTVSGVGYKNISITNHYDAYKECGDNPDGRDLRLKITDTAGEHIINVHVVDSDME